MVTPPQSFWQAIALRRGALAVRAGDTTVNSGVFLFLLQLREAPVKTLVRLADQLDVEAPLTLTGLVTGHEQDSPALRIEREGHPPNAVGRIEAQLLHVRLPRALQRIDARAGDRTPH
jgi:hypothetical protein